MTIDVLSILTAIFDAAEIEYDWRDEHCIGIPCPADFIPDGVFGGLTEKEIVSHPEMTCLTDEAYIIISEDKNGLSFLIELPAIEEEEE